MKLSFDLKIDATQKTYGTKMGLTAEQEIALSNKMLAAFKKWESDSTSVTFSTADILQFHLECAETIPEAIIAAFYAGRITQDLISQGRCSSRFSDTTPLFEALAELFGPKR